MSLSLWILFLPWKVVGPVDDPSLKAFLEARGVPLFLVMAKKLDIPFPPTLTIHLLTAEGGSAPHWAGGYYQKGHLFLRVRALTDLPRVFAHELAHALIQHRLSHHALPRWLEEGLAMHLSGEQVPIPTTAWLALSFPSSMIDLETSFPYDEKHAREAYTRSYWVTSTLLKEGKIKVSPLLASVQQGSSLEEVLMEQSGHPLDYWIDKTRKHLRFYYLFVPIITSASLFWGILSVWTIIAYIRKKRQIKDLDDDTGFPYH